MVMTNAKKNDRVEWLFAKYESDRFGTIVRVDPLDPEMVWVVWDSGRRTETLLGSRESVGSTVALAK